MILVDQPDSLYHGISLYQMIEGLLRFNVLLRQDVLKIIKENCSSKELKRMHAAHLDTIATPSKLNPMQGPNLSNLETPVRISMPVLISGIKAALKLGPVSRRAVIDTLAKLCTYREIVELNEAYAVGEPERAKRH